MCPGVLASQADSGINGDVTSCSSSHCEDDLTDSKAPAIADGISSPATIHKTGLCRSLPKAPDEILVALRRALGISTQKLVSDDIALGQWQIPSQIDGATHGNSFSGLKSLLDGHPALARLLAGSGDLRNILETGAEAISAPLAEEGSSVTATRVLWSMCGCMWSVLAMFVGKFCTGQRTGALAVSRQGDSGSFAQSAFPVLDAHLRHVVQANDDLRTTIASLRRDYLRELTELRERCRQLEAPVEEAVNKVLNEEPIMFFEPFNFVFDESTKDFVRNAVEEKLRLLMLKGWRKTNESCDKELQLLHDRVAELEAENEALHAELEATALCPSPCVEVESCFVTGSPTPDEDGAAEKDAAAADDMEFEDSKCARISELEAELARALQNRFRLEGCIGQEQDPCSQSQGNRKQKRSSISSRCTSPYQRSSRDPQGFLELQRKHRALERKYQELKRRFRKFEDRIRENISMKGLDGVLVDEALIYAGLERPQAATTKKLSKDKHQATFDRLYDDAQRRLQRLRRRTDEVHVMQRVEIHRCWEEAASQDPQKSQDQVEKLRDIHRTAVRCSNSLQEALVKFHTAGIGADYKSEGLSETFVHDTTRIPPGLVPTPSRVLPPTGGSCGLFVAGGRCGFTPQSRPHEGTLRFGSTPFSCPASASLPPQHRVELPRAAPRRPPSAMPCSETERPTDLSASIAGVSTPWHSDAFNGEPLSFVSLGSCSRFDSCSRVHEDDRSLFQRSTAPRRLLFTESPHQISSDPCPQLALEAETILREQTEEHQQLTDVEMEKNSEQKLKQVDGEADLREGSEDVHQHDDLEEAEKEVEKEAERKLEAAASHVGTDDDIALRGYDRRRLRGSGSCPSFASSSGSSWPSANSSRPGSSEASYAASSGPASAAGQEPHTAMSWRLPKRTSKAKASASTSPATLAAVAGVARSGTRCGAASRGVTPLRGLQRYSRTRLWDASPLAGPTPTDAREQRLQRPHPLLVAPAGRCPAAAGASNTASPSALTPPVLPSRAAATAAASNLLDESSPAAGPGALCRSRHDTNSRSLPSLLFAGGRPVATAGQGR